MADKRSTSGRMAFAVANLNASLRVKSYAGAVALADKMRSSSDHHQQMTSPKVEAQKAKSK